MISASFWKGKVVCGGCGADVIEGATHCTGCGEEIYSIPDSRFPRIQPTCSQAGVDRERRHADKKAREARTIGLVRELNERFRRIAYL